MGYQFQARKTCDRCVRVIHTHMASDLTDAQAELDKAKAEAQSATFTASFTAANGEATNVVFATLCPGCVDVIQGHLSEIRLKTKPAVRKPVTKEESKPAPEGDAAPPKSDTVASPPKAEPTDGASF